MVLLVRHHVDGRREAIGHVEEGGDGRDVPDVAVVTSRPLQGAAVSVTHFRTREGAELDNISPRRYFCTQCHVPQTDAKPLVENTFQRARGMQ